MTPSPLANHKLGDGKLGVVVHKVGAIVGGDRTEEPQPKFVRHWVVDGLAEEGAGRHVAEE